MELTKKTIKEIQELSNTLTNQQEGLARQVMDRVGAKWPLYVLCVLAEAGEEPIRFTKLVERVEGISDKMLTQTLKLLERDGLILRAAKRRQVPPRVEYTLTPLGWEMMKVAVPLLRWVVSSIENFEKARIQPTPSGA